MQNPRNLVGCAEWRCNFNEPHFWHNTPFFRHLDFQWGKILLFNRWCKNMYICLFMCICMCLVLSKIDHFVILKDLGLSLPWKYPRSTVHNYYLSIKCLSCTYIYIDGLATAKEVFALFTVSVGIYWQTWSDITCGNMMDENYTECSSYDSCSLLKNE